MVKTNNILGIDNLETKVYRILSIVRALDLFANQKNALVHPSLWDDPFENLFLKAKVFDGTELLDMEVVEKSWYGQCWTEVDESDAMWRIYSPLKDGVRLTTTIGKLFNTIYDMTDENIALKAFVGKVAYKPSKEIKDGFIATAFSDLMRGGQNNGFAKTLLVKRHEFEHECEVRLLFNDINHVWNAKPYVLFHFEASTVVDHVMLDPRMDRRVADAFHLALQRAGCTCPIEQSRLYQAPQLAVNI